MSADNRLCIMPWGGCQWFAWHGSGSESYYEPPAHAHIFESRSEAEEWIDAESQDAYLEYGVTLIGRDEQEIALIETIANCRSRLDNLRTTGRQYPNWSEQT